jgi:hypothetical protein
MSSIYEKPGLVGRAARSVRRLRDRMVRRGAQLDASRRARWHRKGKKNPLPGELIVSLTSYPARFGTLHLTLGCLLDQSIKADRTILWIAHDDLGQVPAAVRALERHGLEIRSCDDLRSFKKLIPALEAFPNAFIATADDDIYYPRGWLETLASGTEEGVITCHRAHRMTRSAGGTPQPYLQWVFAVLDKEARTPSSDLLPTGVGGVLYPPNSLDPQVTDRDLFLRLCPHGDDLWFYWCARMAGTHYRKVGGRFRMITWPASQETSLWAGNAAGGNDRMIQALIDEFGLESIGL